MQRCTAFFFAQRASAILRGMPSAFHYDETPSSGLDPRRIEALWEVRVTQPADYIVLPDGRMDLVARFRTTRGDRVVDVELSIIGPSSRWASVSVEADQRYVGVRFQAGWGGNCLGIDPGSLVDSALHGASVDAILGSDAIRLKQATTIGELRSTVRAIAAERALRAPSTPPTALHAIELLHRSGGRLAIGELASMVGATERSLRRHMHEAVGLSCKVFSGVLRFQRTMRLLESSPSPSLAHAAVEGGYSDQAHLTREFRRHGGFTPGQRPPATLVTMPLD